ncbi:laccase 2 precursor [Mycena leptocephala]|nr:laccase 2 precursor [Mycena leptocephala]
MYFSSSILALSLLSGSIATSIGPVANLPIVNKVIAPDGFTRKTVLAGGTYPGPLIKGYMGNEFRLNVVDQLTDPDMKQSTSIHWHGFFQRNNSWADGVSFVTQCPIAANHSFLYEFQTPGQAGTYWYHSHLSTQYCDGLRGPFVVYDPFDPQQHLYDMDNDDTVITLSDWYHYLAKDAPAIPAPASTLINGLGRYTGGPAVPLAVISVVKGLRYRFRLVATSCLSNYVFSIDGHDMKVIEVDGVAHKPLVVDSLQIFEVDNYWVRANPNNAAITDPATISTSTTPLLETDLRPLVHSPVPGLPIPGGADVVLNLNLAFNFTTAKFSINGASFLPPTVPVLLQVLSGAQSAQDLLPAGNVYTLPPNKVIEISIPGLALGGPHPFHLTGYHNFHVIRSAGSTTYNFKNPVIRDVVSTGLATDNTTFRFVTDNAGPWFLHCHIDWHLET